MKRGLNRTLVGLTTGVLAYYLAGKLTDKKGEQEMAEKKGFQWISAAGEEQDEEQSEPLPMFYVGDEVHLFDPHTGALYYDHDEMGPALYRITEVRYDEQDEVFRYQLEGLSELDWISEDWLSLPFYSKFKRTLAKVPEKSEVTPEMAEMERRILHKALDDAAKKREIDRLLDVMNHGTDAEKKAAKDQLKEITE